MQTIDIEQIMISRELKRDFVAKQLFPLVSYPMIAFKRVTSGETELDASQISRLAKIAQLEISELFSVKGWESKKVKNEFEFKRGDYRAVLNLDTWVTDLYDKESIFHTEMIHTKSVSLIEYIERLNETIYKYRTK